MVDSRHFSASYQQVFLKMNLSEALRTLNLIEPATPIPENDDDIKTAQTAAELLSKSVKKPVFITLRDQGLVGVSEGQFFHWPGVKLEVPIDVVGAGDSVLAGIGLSRCSGATDIEAAYIGNLVGSITVQQIGTTGTATREDILKRHHEYQKQINF